VDGQPDWSDEDAAAIAETPASNGSAPEEVDLDLDEWDYADEADEISPRAWLFGNLLCRQFLTAIFGDGATGKTALLCAMALSLATGRSLIDEYVFQRCTVILLCFEDGEDELRRRLRAARIHYGISKEDIRGRLFIKAVSRNELKLARQGRDGLKQGALVKALERAIERRQAAAVLLDPLVKTHGVPENDNNAMDYVAGVLAELAIKYDIAICTPHHTRKGTPDPGNADMGRGGGSLKDAFRLCYTLTPMQSEDGARFGISDDERASLIRLDYGKVNLVRRSPVAKWFKLIGVLLDNGTELYPHGDEVQTVARWTPPDVFAGPSESVWNQILDDIDKGMENGQRYSSAGAATDRAAWNVVVRHIERTEKQARTIIRAWTDRGILINDDYTDPVDRKRRKGLRVDPTKRPGPRE
jgi:AAA domain